MKTLLEIGERKIVSAAASRGGRYGWCATTKMRWRQFCKYCDGIGINVVSQITHETIEGYAKVWCKNLSVATAQNYISSVNTVIKLLNPSWESCSPRYLVGFARKSVRTAPLSFDMNDINSAVVELESSGFIDLALLVRLAAEFGLRRREASLLDISTAFKDATKHGTIDIQRGTKGGRGRAIVRFVPCNDRKINLLNVCSDFIGDGLCLVRDGLSLKKFYDRISNHCLPILKKYGIKKFHELRVFYACQRYTEITGCAVPCNRVGGDLIATPDLDEIARRIISLELGHSRIQIVSSYVGRKIRRGNRE